MSNDTVVSLAAPARVSDPLTELLRTGARRLIEAAVSAEFEEYLSGFVQEQLPDGRQRVVRNGHLPERKILTGVGEWTCGCPRHAAARVRRRRSARRWCRRTFGAARASMRRFRGCTCTGCPPGRCVRRSARWWARRPPDGLSANVVSRLKRSWDEEYRQWCRRRLDDEWVYLWADGIYSGLRGDHERAVRAGDHWRERPRREALPGHRGRRARVHPELGARCCWG